MGFGGGGCAPAAAGGFGGGGVPPAAGGFGGGGVAPAAAGGFGGGGVAGLAGDGGVAGGEAGVSGCGPDSAGFSVFWFSFSSATSFSFFCPVPGSVGMVQNTQQKQGIQTHSLRPVNGPFELEQRESTSTSALNKVLESTPVQRRPARCTNTLKRSPIPPGRMSFFNAASRWIDSTVLAGTRASSSVRIPS